MDMRLTHPILRPMPLLSNIRTPGDTSAFMTVVVGRYWKQFRVLYEPDAYTPKVQPVQQQTKEVASPKVVIAKEE